MFEMLDKKIILFLKVVETGSFSAAARELYMSQPALSKQIFKLEQQAGVPLFDRSGYRVALTAAGCVLNRSMHSPRCVMQMNRLENL